MSDAVRCGKCGYVYWTSSYENWGTCTKCDTNNDFAARNRRPRLVSSKNIFKTMTLEDVAKEEKDDK